MDEAGKRRASPRPYGHDSLPDRRSDKRVRAVCRIARVKWANDLGLWRVQNISNSGMRFSTDAPLAIDEPIEIALSEDTLLIGRIVWAKDGACGVAFTDTIDADATLAELFEQQRSEGYRALRLPVELKAILATDTGSYAIDLVDISQSGAGFRSAIPMEPGALVNLVLPSDDKRRSALIRWVSGLCGGLWFTQPIERSFLESVKRFRSQ